MLLPFYIFVLNKSIPLSDFLSTNSISFSRFCSFESKVLTFSTNSSNDAFLVCFITPLSLLKWTGTAFSLSISNLSATDFKLAKSMF